MTNPAAANLPTEPRESGGDGRDQGVRPRWAWICKITGHWWKQDGWWLMFGNADNYWVHKTCRLCGNETKQFGRRRFG
jgi:hypothetical protein